MVTTKLNLSMTEPSVRQIYAKQGDTGRVLDITLDQTPEDGTLRILRPDGTEVTSEAVTGGEVSESGETVTFDSLTEADVTELTVGIEPVQDLNGYDKPWVGGAGKNKLPFPYKNTSGSASGITYTVNADSSVSFYGTSSSAVYFNFASEDQQYNFDANTYTFSVNGGGSNPLVSGVTVTLNFRVGGTNKNGTTLSSTKQSSTWSVPESGYLRCYITIPSGTNVGTSSNPMTIYPMFRFASETDDTWQPYSNICPITGHDEVRVYDDPVYGKTIKWNQLIQNGNFADTSNWGTGGGTITVSGNVATVTTPGQWNLLWQAFDWAYGHVMLARASVKKFGESGSIFVKVVNDFAYSNQQFTKGIATNDVWTDVVFCGTYTKTPSDSTAPVRFGVQEYRSANSNNGFQIKNVGVFDLTEMFGEGNEPTIEEFEALFPKDYYPYNTGEETTVSAVNGDPNRQYITSLGQTVYGGTLDMVTGVLTVDRAMVDLGTLAWSYSSTANHERMQTGGLASVIKSPTSTSRLANILCSAYKTITADGTYNHGEGIGIAVSTNGTVFVYDTAYTDAASFKTAMSGVYLVYEHATPVEYQLTPQQIKTLVGTNNVWASSGDIVSIKFAYGGLLSELPSDATSVVGKCYCDVEQNGVSSMPFTLNVKKNERQ